MDRQLWVIDCVAHHLHGSSSAWLTVSFGNGIGAGEVAFGSLGRGLAATTLTTHSPPVRHFAGPRLADQSPTTRAPLRGMRFAHGAPQQSGSHAFRN